MPACHGNKYNFCWYICSGLAPPGGLPTRFVLFTAFPTQDYLRHPCVGAGYQQPNPSTWSFWKRETKNYSAREPHRASSRPSSRQRVVSQLQACTKKESMWGANLAYSRSLKESMTTAEENRVLWQRVKTRRWKEYDHLKKELLKINIPNGKTHLEDLMGPLSISNKAHFPSQGKLWTCHLQAQLVSKCLHKKHNNNCLRERCSNLHETLSSR